jgi:farnesyl-diphosphate farnesyltransferase
MTHFSSRISRIAEAEAYQKKILPGVSRTFALTIPQLPSDLRGVVTNAYLLCRILDTIEDETALTVSQKASFHEQFLAVLREEEKAQDFAKEVTPLLSEDTSPDERELMANTPLIVRYTHSLDASQQGIMVKCVSIMCQGMGCYQNSSGPKGLSDMSEVDRYCYHVAGVVGEMLTELFCQHSSEVIGKNRADMLALAPSFGEGLQLTNILKDIWDDRQHGVCWLPRKEFQEFGVELGDIAPGKGDKAFVSALRYMIGVAHAHLRNAFHYTLMIPPQEVGIRCFCLWAIGLAVLTLRRIHSRPAYSSGQQVKVSRGLVRATIIGTNLMVRQDWMLKPLFSGVTAGLPITQLEKTNRRLSAWVTEPATDSGSRLESKSSSQLLRDGDK